MSTYDSYTCDVLCLGGGGAAITAAISASSCGADVILASKEPLGYGDTRISMGMISNPGMIADDSPEEFYNDLLKCGEYLNDPKLVSILAERGYRAREIIEEYGHLFQRNKDGTIDSEIAFISGGHVKARTLRSPPSNGIGIGNALRAATVRSNVRVFEETAAYKLLKDGQQIAGAVCYDLIRGRPLIITAKVVVLATGGAGWLYYPHTDCMSGACGDGYSLAYEAGAELIDMEQVQFIPFALTHPSSMCGIFLGDPVMAAPSGVIRNRNGDVILDNVHTHTRAHVSKTIATFLSRGEGTSFGGLLLDLSANLLTEDGRQRWENRRKLGQFDAVRAAYGEKAYYWQEAWDIAPSAHYNMGGVKVTSLTQSNVRALYAAGQVMGGVFGGDRLGSASLTEIFVFGELSGKEAAYAAKELSIPKPEDSESTADELESLIGRCGKHSPISLKRRLQHTMWKNVGIIRDEDGMHDALSEIKLLSEEAQDIRISSARTYNRDVLDALELRHMLKCALMITKSALARRETRGAHLRLDYPERDDKYFKCNMLVCKSGDEMRILSVAR